MTCIMRVKVVLSLLYLLANIVGLLVERVPIVIFIERHFYNCHYFDIYVCNVNENIMKSFSILA